jgi:hypothetical protein
LEKDSGGMHVSDVISSSRPIDVLTEAKRFPN